MDQQSPTIPYPRYSIGHFLNEPASGTAFALTRFEDMAEPDVEAMHRHTFYEIIWIEDGTSSHLVDYRSYDLSPATLFCISPGQVHYFEEWRHLRGLCIMFTEDFLLAGRHGRDSLFGMDYIDNLYAVPCISLTEQSTAELRPTLEMLVLEWENPEPSTAILQSLLHVVLARLQRIADRGGSHTVPGRYTVLYRQLQQALEVHYHRNLSVREYAAMLNISPHHLNAVAQRVTGRTAGEIIRARSILEAKRLLTFTDYTVAEIADRLGFFDASYFARFFRRDTGVSPARFRADISEQYRIL